MALSVKRGSFATATASGTQAVTGVGFQPKAVIFFHARVTTADGTANANMTGGFGVGTDEAEEWGLGVFDLDASAASDTAHRLDDAKAIILLNDAVPTVDAAAAYASSDSDGFTLTWDAAPDAAYIVEYLALGGTDISGVDSGTFMTSIAPATQSVTGVGFVPKLLLFAAGQATPPAQAVHSSGAIGAAVSATQRGTMGMRLQDAGATMIVTSVGSDERALTLAQNNSVLASFDLVSMDADGFTIDVTAGTSSRGVLYLALGGALQAAVLSDLQKTSTGTQAKTGAGFQPKALLALSRGGTALAVDTHTGADHYSMNIGIADGAGQESSVSLTSADNVADSIAKRSHSQTKLLRFRNAADSTVQAECDVTSLDADGYTLDWTTADAVAREIIVIALGESAGGGLTLPVDTVEPVTFSGNSPTSQITASAPTGDFTMSGPTPSGAISSSVPAGVVTFSGLAPSIPGVDPPDEYNSLTLLGVET